MFVHSHVRVLFRKMPAGNYTVWQGLKQGRMRPACRWQYELREKGSNGEYFTIEQDERGRLYHELPGYAL